VLFIAALGVVDALVPVILETPFAPWARSFGLWQTLTGDWHGELMMPDGRTDAIYFEIRHPFPLLDRCRDCPKRIEGRARVCEAQGTVRDYDIAGNVSNWRGTKFYLALSMAAEQQPGLAVRELRGEWEGDSIRATGDLVKLGHTVSIEATDSSDRPTSQQVRYTLRRGTEDDFLAACRTGGKYAMTRSRSLQAADAHIPLDKLLNKVYKLLVLPVLKGIRCIDHRVE
jgi:hypothetical protein